MRPEEDIRIAAESMGEMAARTEYKSEKHMLVSRAVYDTLVWVLGHEDSNTLYLSSIVAESKLIGPGPPSPSAASPP